MLDHLSLQVADVDAAAACCVEVFASLEVRAVTPLAAKIAARGTSGSSPRP